MHTLRSARRSPFRSLFAAVAIMGTLAACGDDGLVDPDPLVGVYTATTFRATPTGLQEINVLEQGGSLTITIAANNSTTGTLTIPASVTGDVAIQESMAGTVERNGNGVTFEQTADTFVRDLNWTVQDNTISVTNQSVGGATYTIVLTRS